MFSFSVRCFTYLTFSCFQNYNPKFYDIGLNNTLNEGNCAYIGIIAHEDAMIGNLIEEYYIN